MVGLVLSPETIKTAPPEVRAWLRSLIDGDLGGVPAPAHDKVHSALDSLAALSLPEAAALLQGIRDDYPTCQVFFEFGRDTVPGAGPSAGRLHRVTIAELARHARIADGRRLVGCIDAINAAFQALRDDPTASLFAFDQQGGCYVHPLTHESIRRLWHEVVGAAAADAPRAEDAASSVARSAATA